MTLAKDTTPSSHRCALDDNVQKQQGKKISIDLFMNTFVTHHLIDIVTTASRRHQLPSTSHFTHIRCLGRLCYIDIEEQRRYVGETSCL
jgi:hypothetical protein